MIKSAGHLEHKIGDRTFHFFCDSDAQWGELHDALSVMKQQVINKIVEIHNASKPQEEKKDEQADCNI